VEAVLKDSDAESLWMEIEVEWNGMNAIKWNEKEEKKRNECNGYVNMCTWSCS